MGIKLACVFSFIFAISSSYADPQAGDSKAETPKENRAALFGLAGPNDEIVLNFKQLDAGKCRKTFCSRMGFSAAVVIYAEYEAPGKKGTQKKVIFVRDQIDLGQATAGVVREIDVLAKIRTDEINQAFQNIPSDAKFSSLLFDVFLVQESMPRGKIRGAFLLPAKVLATSGTVGELTAEMRDDGTFPKNRKNPSFASVVFTINVSTEASLENHIEEFFKKLFPQGLPGSPTEKQNGKSPGRLEIIPLPRPGTPLLPEGLDEIEPEVKRPKADPKSHLI